ncbi:sigma-70 family RNA polymerase sigma factor [Desulfuribacillus alkaliarsenatis]|uniref:HTH cro/C1-type domain-containing protein n=1 Tax=Desulfuribacillus alkaliarsenatis TaxID=766136 RepID=A0A1E5FZ85_9FIRM|nr:sigma-70 family RNA polymerase sigma factor [Desulfuribacillus alkaliarsenatis]OEF95881.1 hypothetical protein BHF68_10835 [Desulfuribacillus alkaliarsenatis]
MRSARLKAKKKTKTNNNLTLLFQKYQLKNSKKIETEIFKQTCYLVEIIARKYVDRGVHIDDLLQIGNLGLVKAIRRYDAGVGVQFATYATPTIEGEIKRYFRDRSWDVSVPRRITELHPKIDYAYESLSHQLQRHPTNEELADYLGISLDELIEAKSVKSLYNSISLDTTYTDDDYSDSLHHMIGKNDPELETFIARKTVLNALNELTRRERLLIYYRYYQGLSQRALADRFKVSQMQISRLERKALGKLKKHIN